MATTSGFQVSNMPRIDFADPRLLATNYGAILPAVGQGFQLAEQVQMAPIRRQLAQIQVEDAQARRALAPLEQRRLLAQISEAEQNAAIPRILPGSVTFEEGAISPYDIPATDDEGNLTGPTPKGDLVQIQSEDVFGPGGVQTTRQTRKTVATGEQRMQAQAAAQAGIEYKNALAEAAALRAQNDAIKAQADLVRATAAQDRAKLLQSNPAIGFVDVKRSDGRTYRQYFAKSDPTKIVHEVDRGELGGDIINFGGLTVQPGAGGATVTPRAAQGASLTVPGIDPDVAELAGLVGGSPAVRVAAPAARDNFNVGQTYTDASGNRATYLGNGQWRQVQ